MAIEIRQYRPGDHRPVLSLLRRSLGGWARRGDEWFSWKHYQNPAGHSLLHVAEFDGEIIGFRALMRWNFRLGDRILSAVRGADAAVDRRFRRRGIWEAMTHAQLEELPPNIKLAFSYGHPDTRAGYRKLGWQTVATLNKGVIPRRPGRIIRSKLRRDDRDNLPVSAVRLAERFEPAGEVLRRSSARDLIQRLEQVPSPTLITRRNEAYLRWRYCDVPGQTYFANTRFESGKLALLLIMRSRPAYGLTEIEVTESLAASNEKRLLVPTLLRTVSQSGGDYLAILADRPSLLAKATDWVGSAARLGHGNDFLYDAVGDVPIDCGERASWSFSLGDFDPGF